MKKKQIFVLAVVLFVSIIHLSQTSVDLIKAEMNRNEGITYYNNEYYQKALYSLSKALEFNSKDYLARFFLGWSYYKSGFIQNALMEWSNLKELGYEDNLLDNMLDSIMFQEGKLAKDIKLDKFSYYSSLNGRTIQNNFFLWPLGLTVDPRNNIYIAAHRSYSILQMVNGAIVKSLNIFGKFLGYPYDIVFNKMDDTLYVSDFKNNIIYKLSKKGIILDRIGLDENKNPMMLGPAGLTIDESGNLYCIDQGNNRILKFDQTGKFLFSFGKAGKAYGAFLKAVDIEVDQERKQLFISNSYNQRIDVFDYWGNFLFSIGESFLKNPKGLYLYKNNFLYIVDQNEIKLYDLTTKTFTPVDLGTYELYDPYFVLIDKNQNLIVSDPYQNNINYYIPKSTIYLNLDVKLERIDIRSWPLVVCYISVKDQAGNTIYGLDDSNFSFMEYDTQITRLETNYSYLRDDNKALSIVIDGTPTMKGKTDKINSILNQLFDADEDQIQYNLYFTSTTNQVKDFNEDDLTIRDQVNNKNNYQTYKYIERTLYTATSSFFHKFVKGGIIYITDGNFNNDSFQYYSQNDIINYAKSNYIPVYVFYLGDGQGKTFLKELASKTSGVFYEGDSLFNADQVLYEFKNYQSPYYIVYYKSPYLKSPKFFRKVFVTVDYNGRVGKNWLGYYMTE